MAVFPGSMILDAGHQVPAENNVDEGAACGHFNEHSLEDKKSTGFL